MTIKPTLRVAAIFTILLTSLGAMAAGRKDKAASAKIDEAVNVHYIAAQFDKAESALQAAIKTCGSQDCSGEVLGKAYLYLGIVRGNGKQDLAGARQAFEAAVAADPNITIDPSLVVPAVLDEFNKASSKSGEPGGKTRVSANGSLQGSGAGAHAGPVGDLRCSPASGYEVQLGRPIPFHCERMEGVIRGELHYRGVGSENYQAQLMTFSSKDATLSAQVPCDALTKKGTLSVYVVAQNEDREPINTFGSEEKPAEYTIVDAPSKPAPSLPGSPAPEVCSDLLKSLNSGVSEGEVCKESDPCKHGLFCDSGICQKAPTCELGSDCGSGHCIDGYCVMDEHFADAKKPNQWLIGLNFAMDFWVSSSANNACGGENPLSGSYSCYSEGKTKINISPSTAPNRGVTNSVPMADQSGNIKTTLVPATMRALLSLDRIVSPQVTLGLRLGMAFNGGPAKMAFVSNSDGTYRPTQEGNFLPLHAELRAAYWFSPLTEPGLHPFVALAGGVAQVDAKVSINGFSVDTDTKQAYGKRNFDAWHRIGSGFGAGSFGAMLSLNQRHNILLAVNTMVFFPNTGLTIEPSLGYLLGF